MCLLFFIKFLFFIKWQPFKSYEKWFLFYQKSALRSQDIQIFVFSSFPLFFLPAIALEADPRKILKFVINCLNMNLITHFVWYLDKEIRCGIETLSIYPKNHAENVLQKLAPNHFLILLNNPDQELHTRNSFKNKVFWQRIIKKPNRSSGHKTSSEKILCYILSEQVCWCNVKQFLSYSKIYICKFMQVNSWHHKLFNFHLTFWNWKVWKGREKTQKFKYPENKNSFLDEIKNIFHGFVRAIIWWKIKTW